MLEFSIKGVKVCLRFSFFAVICLLMLIDRSTYILWGLYACMIHEIGHLIIMSIMDVRVYKIIFYGVGIKIVPKTRKIISVYREIFILSGGCLINFLMFGIFYLLSGGDETLEFFGVLNLVTGIFNILPLKNFDGGKIAELLIENYISINKQTKAKNILKVICTVILTAGGIYLIVSGKGNFTFLLTVGYFIAMTIFM